MIALSVVLIGAQLADLLWPRGDGRSASPASVVFAVGLMFALAVYPTGRFVPRWTLAAASVGSALFVASAIVGPDVAARFAWPLPIAPILLLLALGGQGYRYLRRSSPAEREAVRWPLLGVAVLLALTLLPDLVALGLTGQPLGATPLGPAARIVTSVAFLLPAVGLLIGLLVPRGAVVDRGIALLLSTISAAVVLAVVFALVSFLVGLAVPPPYAAWIGAAAVAIACVLVLPWAARLGTRVVFRRRMTPAAAARELTAQLRGTLDPADVPGLVVQSVRNALQSESVELRREGFSAVWARAGAPGVRSAAGTTIRYLGLPVARLEVSPRPGESTLTPADREMVETLADAAAAALHGARLGTAFPELTDRERQVLAGITRGLPNSAIAELLGVSSKTVANYVSLVLTKLRVPDRERAAELARRRAA
ncbi:hypothetical protein BH10ACT7_BH10ACT7_24140 [soil metagenome]